MKRRDFLASGLLVASHLAWLPSAHAQITGMSDAINKSGRQRMLSQRLAKCYLQIGMDIDSDQSKKILELSLTTFDRQLAELLAFAPTPEIKSALTEMKKTWQVYKQLLAGKWPGKRDGKAIIALSDEVLRMADNITAQLERQAGNSAGQLVNLSGRQRMLSQKMAKYYQAAQWEIAPPDGSNVLEAARKEFVAGLSKLNHAPSNTVKIKEELTMAQQQWVFFENALKQMEDSKGWRMAATNVATTSERILEIMDRVTGMYQQLS